MNFLQALDIVSFAFFAFLAGSLVLYYPSAPFAPSEPPERDPLAPTSIMRGFSDLDREASRKAVLEQQAAQKAALDQQMRAPKPKQQGFRDGRMSDEDYARYEKQAMEYRKQSLLDRIANSFKSVSSFDMMEAQQIADQDPEFAEALKRAYETGKRNSQRKEFVDDYEEPERSRMSNKIRQLRAQRDLREQEMKARAEARVDQGTSSQDDEASQKPVQ